MYLRGIKSAIGDKLRVSFLRIRAEKREFAFAAQAAPVEAYQALINGILSVLGGLKNKCLDTPKR